MAFNTRNWVPGELVTAAQLNTYMRDTDLDLDARAHHVLQHDQTSAGTPADTAEHVLHTFTIPANYFAVNGRTVRLTATGTCGVNSKTVLVRLGGASGEGIAGATSARESVWWIEALISRVGLNTQRVASILIGLDTGGGSFAQGGLITQVETNPLELVVTGQSHVGTANDVTYQTGWLEFMGA